VRWIAVSLLIANVLAIVAGALHLFRPEAVGNLAGILIILALLGNCCLAVFSRWGLPWLAFSLPAFVAMPMANFGISNARMAPTYSDVNGIYPFALYLAYFGLFGIGIVLAAGALREKVGKQAKPRWIVVRAGLWGLLTIGLVLAWTLLSRRHIIGVEMYVAPVAMFVSFFLLCTAGMLWRLAGRPGGWYGCTVRTMGVGFFLVFMLPLILTPISIANAEVEFSRAFGSNWRDQLGDKTQFRQQRLQLPAYFLGIEPERPVIHEHILFYQGTQGVDEGLSLFYDAFLPPPGEQRAAIIRIHGGAWVTGNKGRGHRLQLSKFLASRGYVVFDIQYGLNSTAKIARYFNPPGYLRGDYSVDDMVRHVGIFTSYIADKADYYQFDTERVIVSGGSAGGQLAIAAGLAMSGGHYADWFSPDLIVLGIVPMYPGNGIAGEWGITGAMELMDPGLLVEEVSPPVLIFQGTHDGMVPANTAGRFAESYRAKANQTCVVLKMPLGGHSADLHFSGNYNQVYLYYLERFLYLVTRPEP
jgi:acetyl esterase/lipase